MEIQDIRRARLAQLIRDHYESQADFVFRTGINQGEVSSLLKNKSFGEKKARKIEVDSGLPNMWLDTPIQSPVTDAITPAKIEPKFVPPAPSPELQWVYPDEAKILSNYRRMASVEKQLLSESAEAMPKKPSARFAVDNSK